MSRRHTIAILRSGVICIASLVLSPVTVGAQLSEYSDRIFWLTIKSGYTVEDLESLSTHETSPLIGARFRRLRTLTTVHLREIADTRGATISRLKEIPAIADARPMAIGRLCAVPNDPSWNLQWNFQRLTDQDVDLERARNVTTGSSAIR